MSSSAGVPQVEVASMQVTTGKDMSVRVKRYRSDLIVTSGPMQHIYCLSGVHIP